MKVLESFSWLNNLLLTKKKSSQNSTLIGTDHNWIRLYIYLFNLNEHLLVCTAA